MAVSTIRQKILKRHFQKTNISASTYYVTVSIDVSLAGYTPIAIVHLKQNQAMATCYGIELNGNTASFGLSTTNQNTVSSRIIDFDVLYI